jgi:rRNA maturation endonuclease Nob1
VSFGTTLGKTKDSTNPQAPGNDSMSSPTDISKITEIEKLNEEQQALIAKLQAEVDQLKINQPTSGNTKNPTTTAKDSGSNKPLSEETAADSDADSGATG